MPGFRQAAESLIMGMANQAVYFPKHAAFLFPGYAKTEL